jgi:branched-chain amino acid transport system permease protein
VIALVPRRVLGGIAVAVVAALPYVLDNPYYLNAMIFFGINALLVTGLNWILGHTGLVSLGQAGFYGLGAYVSAILAVRADVPAVIATAAALAVTALLAWAIAIPSVRLRGHDLAMATLGFGIILQIAFEQMDFLTQGPKGLTGIPYYHLGGWAFDSDLRSYYLVWAAVGFATWLSANLARSRMGRALRAIEGDELAARASGIDVRRTKITAFVLGSMLAGLAGGLYAHYVGFISPGTFGFMLSIELVVMVIVGGSGSLVGPILGAGLFTVLPEYLRAYRDYDVVLFGVVLVVVLMFMPSGLAGALQRASTAVSRTYRRRRATAAAA